MTARINYKKENRMTAPDDKTRRRFLKASSLLG